MRPTSRRDQVWASGRDHYAPARAPSRSAKKPLRPCHGIRLGARIGRDTLALAAGIVEVVGGASHEVAAVGLARL